MIAATINRAAVFVLLEIRVQECWCLLLNNAGDTL